MFVALKVNIRLMNACCQAVEAGGYRKTLQTPNINVHVMFFSANHLVLTCLFSSFIHVHVHVQPPVSFISCFFGLLFSSKNELTINKIFSEHERIHLNPLSPNSDQHQISPCNINAHSTSKVMRIKDVITQGEFS